MSKVRDFIDSGILNEYCLGLLQPEEVLEVERMARLYPEVQKAIDQLLVSIKPSDLQQDIANKGLKGQILETLGQLGEPPVFDLQCLPLINVYSDSEQWQRTLAGLSPAPEFRNLYVYPLRNHDGVEQFILWARHEIRPERHHDEHESFLILEGECECRIGGETVRLKAGDFVRIPLKVEHTVRVVSPEPVKAVVQRVKL
ncbi:cupin domain-containing protein [Larkinella sp. VNQ87]|uniref:cupin domain-containing protein n=1 Tax=Larkinella sp. VNQ87 TaxID=3400921 RepID=UPI003C088233